MSESPTLYLAKCEREAQGPWEMEVTYGGEFDLHQHLQGCVKNPGHAQFIPVHNFNLSHLPIGYREQDLLDFLLAVADLTVRLSVRQVSPGRPRFVPGSDQLYPCYHRRGRDLTRVGTGTIHHLELSTTQPTRPSSCTCVECRDSPHPKEQFAYIYVHTAAHVVFDDTEAASTTAHLFYDEGSTLESCPVVVSLSGSLCLDSDLRRDGTKLRFVTHDLTLAHRLQTRLTLAQELASKLAEFFANKDVQDRSLNVMVSHPHGCSKQVSLGWDVGSYLTDGYCYSTASCPGSSGALVISQNSFVWSFLGSIHAGNCEHECSLNFSCLKHALPWFVDDS